MLKRRTFNPILVGTPGRMWDMLSAFGQKPRCLAVQLQAAGGLLAGFLLPPGQP